MTRRSERGQASVLIIGFAGVLALVVALVVDASAAYLHRQGLDTLADGAALNGADLGATGEEVYGAGVPQDGSLTLAQPQARRAVAAYLAQAGAYERYPGLRYAVTVDPATHRIRVELTAPLDLPLEVPGAADRATIGATGSAVVGVDE